VSALSLSGSVATVRGAVSPSRRLRMGVFCVALGVIVLWTMSLRFPGSAESTMQFNLGSAISIPSLAIPLRATNLGLGLLCIAVGGFMIARRGGGRSYALLSVALGASLCAFIIWAANGNSLAFTALLQLTIAGAIPLMFGGMSGVMCERSGVINIAIEGQFLAGAFLGAVIASATGSDWLGVGAAALAGAFMGAILAFLALRYHADQIIVGVVIVTFATGLTDFLTNQVLNNHQATLNSPPTFPDLPVPLLDRIPILGPALFDQNVLAYVAVALVVALQIALFHTRWGLRSRAVGEHPEAAETVGISVIATRYVNVILGGAAGGIGGAAFTIGGTGEFVSGISSGLGYVALAAMIFGRWIPLRIAAATLLFGFANCLQSFLSILNVPIPPPFLEMAPYLVTIFAVAGLVGRVRPPAADGQPYVKG
jgi:general nucleoside transport system permease protein